MNRYLSRILSPLVLYAGVALTAHAAEFNLSTATVADIQDAMNKGALTSEKLVQLYLARIEAYDQKGPALNTVITLNKNALAEARALDAERRERDRRLLCQR